ncbi:MAG TPA: hypothetical protein VLA77_01420 [Candidatus Saccharimonadales bacterium]|nr:hypothetical protein [Candidatus Saccharimonadales bacterium]
MKNQTQHHTRDLATGHSSVHPHGSYKPAPPLSGTGQADKPEDSLASEIQAKHEESKKRYPELSLSRNEYVIESIRRHPIGLVSIWALVIFLVLIALFGLVLYEFSRPTLSESFAMYGQLPTAMSLFPGVLLLDAFFVLGGVISTIVYNGNRFYLTNESIFQHVQSSLFSTRMQVVNLINVEDASNDQKGILQQVLNYGTLRLSTQGEETTYHFYYVANPKRVVGVVNEAAERAVMRLEGIPVNER